MTEDTGVPTPETSSNSAKDADAPKMSEIATIGNVFIEPGATFEDLRRKPRFLIGSVLIILLFSVFQIVFIEKIGLDTIVRQRIEASSSASSMSKEAKDTMVAQQSGTIAKVATYVITPIVMLIVFAIGGLIYWGGANAMGGSMTFFRGVSVWVYSSIPPTLLFAVSNLIVLFLKNAEEIDLARSQQGIIQANPTFFLDGKSQPVLNAILSTFDLFALFGWVLAAIGLQKVGKISSGAAWGIIILLALVGMTVKVVAALVFG